MVVRFRALLVFLLALTATAASANSGCWFLRDSARELSFPSDVRSVKVDNYFRIYYSASDPRFQNAHNGIPDILDKRTDVLLRSRYLLQTVLAWKIPATRTDMGKPELSVYFLPLPADFAGTVRTAPDLRIVLNDSLLDSKEFSAWWVHFLTHAVQLQYRSSGDYWFYEATAGWMEGQFDGYSGATGMAQHFRMNRPGIPITDDLPVAALGASRFVATLSRPYRDVVRQIWEQWSYGNDQPLLDVIQKVLSLNHLPGLASYLQNYFLLANASARLGDNSEVVVPPYAAVVFRGFPDQHAGGAVLQFTPRQSSSYLANVLFYNQEKNGTLAMKAGSNESWSVRLPYANMESFVFILVNPSGVELKGRVSKAFDSSIPAVLDYFRTSPQEEGLSIEWRTVREDGVAFWNLYKSQDGKRVKVNEFPIPATIDSNEGIHYLFLDSSASAMYWLEAITPEGFSSSIAAAQP